MNTFISLNTYSYELVSLCSSLIITISSLSYIILCTTISLSLPYIFLLKYFLMLWNLYLLHYKTGLRLVQQVHLHKTYLIQIVQIIQMVLKVLVMLVMLVLVVRW